MRELTNNIYTWHLLVAPHKQIFKEHLLSLYNINDADRFNDRFFQMVIISSFTGWGSQSWTVFYGPNAITTGGCERKD